MKLYFVPSWWRNIIRVSVQNGLIWKWFCLKLWLTLIETCFLLCGWKQRWSGRVTVPGHRWPGWGWPRLWPSRDGQWWGLNLDCWVPEDTGLEYDGQSPPRKISLWECICPWLFISTPKQLNQTDLHSTCLCYWSDVLLDINGQQRAAVNYHNQHYAILHSMFNIYYMQLLIVMFS